MQEKSLYPKQKNNLVYKTFNGKTVIVKGDFSSFLLNSTGTFLWKLCNGKNSIKKMITKLCRKYNLEETKAKKDVFSFLKSLHKNQLIDF